MNSGDVYSKLTVLADLGTRRTRSGVRRFIRCGCSCGNEIDVRAAYLKNGHTRSCGCLVGEATREANTTHGATSGDRTRAYRIWCNMKQRCANPSEPAFPNYGGRGIQVCSRWLTFENFLMDMGEPQGTLTLDRIDNDRGYSAENCRWASMREQANNRRNSIKLEINGVTKTLADWARCTGVKYTTARARFLRGVPAESIFGLGGR